MSKILLPALGALFLAACQSFQTPGATHEEKTAALSAHLVEWEPEVLVNQFAAPRTAQLFSGLNIDPATKRVSANSTGLASLLTADGYALTATHVLGDGPVSILQLESPRAGQLTLTPAGVVFAPQGAPEQSIGVDLRLLKASPVRLVHRFPGADLALIHLPRTPAATFQLAPRPPAPDTTVFSYGSNLSGSASAGKILQATRHGRTWRLTTSIPLRKGDSGGPVMDPSGRLVAIVSRGRTRPFSKQLTATIANGVSPEAVRALVESDRSAASSATLSGAR